MHDPPIRPGRTPRGPGPDAGCRAGLLVARRGLDVAVVELAGCAAIGRLHIHPEARRAWREYDALATSSGEI